MNTPANKKILLTLFFVVFLDLIGIGLIIPILAPLFLDPHSTLVPFGSSFATRTMYLGLLTAAYPLAQFFGAPLLGGLSDRRGRKPIMLLSLLGTFIGYILFALGIIFGSLPLLFISRILDGFTGGNIAVANSAIADVSTAETKAKNFGLVGMAFGLGFILGPFLGGVLSDSAVVSWFSSSTPFWVAAILSLLNILFVWKLFPETVRARVTSRMSIFTGFHNIAVAFKLVNLRTLFATTFLFVLGFNFFIQFFQVYLIEKFAFTQADIGYVFAFIGLCVAIVQGTIVRFVAKRHQPRTVLRVSLFLLACVFPAFLLAPAVAYIYLAIPFLALFNGLSYPNTTALVSSQADAASQGEIMGISQSLQSIAHTIPPLVSGLVVAFHIALPIILASVFVFAAWLVFVVFYHPDQKLFHEVE